MKHSKQGIPDGPFQMYSEWGISDGVLRMHSRCGIPGGAFGMNSRWGYSRSECDIRENFDTNECPNIFVSTKLHE